MSVAMQIDTREFARAMQEYVKVSKRTIAEAMNTKAFHIALGATNTTEKANAAEIEAQLGAIGYNMKQITRGKNAGKYRKAGMIVSQNSLAERIIRARRSRLGIAQPGADEIGPIVERFIKARLRSVAFLKSGWLDAVKALDPITKDKGKGPKRDRTAKRFTAEPIGGATPAAPGLNPTSTIYNSAVSKQNVQHAEEALAKFAGAGLQTAIANEVKSIEDYVAKKMQEASPHP